VDELRSADPFRDLDDDELAALVARGQVRTVEPGPVTISRPGADGQLVDLGERGPGGSFGEPSLLDPGPRTALVTATEPCRFFVLDRPALLAFLAECPEAMPGVLAGIGRQLRMSQEMLFAETVKQHALQVQLHAGRYRSLAQLVAGVAHEINTPLGIITTAASILAQDLSDLVCDAGPITGPIQDAMEAAALISSNLERASRLVERFKSLSTSQAVEVVEEGDLRAVVDDVVALYGPKARAAGLTITVRDERADPELPWIGDAGHLTEALLNLLSNVERYAYPGQAGGRAEVVLTGDDGHVDVTVRDFGRGIPAVDLERVWEPFFTTGRSQGGTGLGLPVVNSLVSDGMHGSADIRSERGKGTSVRLRLPRTHPEHTLEQP
jgi:signal transduction histidine kinase